MTAEPTTRPARKDWPRQLRLPGQAAAPEGPVDMYMMYLMHHAFRRDLAAFAAAVPHTPVEDTATWRALADRWALFAEALHHHHAGEDPWLWPALLERADDEERETLLAMEAEHEEIDPMLRRRPAGFARLAAGAGEDCRAALAVRLAAARESLGRHLAHEETEAIGSSRRTSCQADWDELDEKFQDDITFGQVVALVPWAVSEVPASALPDLFARTGGAHRLIWRLTRRRFAGRRPGRSATPRRLRRQKPKRSRWPRSHCPASGILPLLAQPLAVVGVPGGEPASRPRPRRPGPGRRPPDPRRCPSRAVQLIPAYGASRA